MSQTVICPDCGRSNEPGSDHCAGCNFPFDPALAPPSDAETPEPSPPVAPPAASTPPYVSVERIARPLRPRPRRVDQTSSTLWILFAVICGAIVLYIAIKANVDRRRASTPVEGSTAEQQKRVDELVATLERDSTDVEARIHLANVYYDTGNWAEAAAHYRRALARDSSRTGAIVDLGVCYYNMGESEEAERYFLLALARDAHHPIALFNLGIVAERRGRLEDALSFFHRSLQSGPPEEMRQPLVEAMTRVQEQTGRKPTPLPDGS